MKLIEQITIDRISAMKNKDDLKKNLLGCLIGDSTKLDKVPTDEFVTSMIKKFIKGAEETAKSLTGNENFKEFIKADDNFLKYTNWKKCITEIIILESYLPKQLTENEILAFLHNCIKLGGMTNLGQIMKYFKENHSGKYDGALVSKLAKDQL